MFKLPYVVAGEQRELTVTVEPFALDRFEVTAGRFRHFLDAYESSGKPTDGSGAQPGTPNSGWRAAWNDDPTLMPKSASSLAVGLASCDEQTEQPDQPATCVNWYVAQAFCIWDGGRLPTEREWTFAAMGGDEQRPYPWSMTPYDAQIDREHACFKNIDMPCEHPESVGAHALGAGKWNTQDLAGNVSEWVFTPFEADLGQSACDADAECDSTQRENRRIVKGGAYLLASDLGLSQIRGWDRPERRDAMIGLRCVRDPR